MKIQLLEVLEGDLFGSHKAIYLGEKPIIATCAKVYGGRESITINKKDKVTVNNDAIINQMRTPLLLGVVYEIEGVSEIYAKNPSMGGVINITKVIGIAM